MKKKDENLKNQIEKRSKIKIIIKTLERRRSRQMLKIKTNPKVNPRQPFILKDECKKNYRINPSK